MERLQSTWENLVDYDLSESGVHPLRLEELLDIQPTGDATGGNLARLLKQELVYTQSNGTPELRSAIANLYPGVTADHIEVTNGGSEAN
jgi:aspartate/methionine/tyrosine aminotransferase